MQVISLLRQRHFNLTEFAVVVLVRGTVGERVVVGSLFRGRGDRILDGIGVEERHTSSLKGKLIHGVPGPCSGRQRLQALLLKDFSWRSRGVSERASGSQCGGPSGCDSNIVRGANAAGQLAPNGAPIHRELSSAKGLGWRSCDSLERVVPTRARKKLKSGRSPRARRHSSGQGFQKDISPAESERQS